MELTPHFTKAELVVLHFMYPIVNTSQTKVKLEPDALVHCKNHSIADFACPEVQIKVCVCVIVYRTLLIVHWEIPSVDEAFLDYSGSVRRL